jgi:hypothetical protein
MKPHTLLPLAALLGTLHANEALDILEGKKDANDVVVAPPAGEAPILSGAVGTPSADGKVTKPFVPSEPSAFSKKSHEIFDPIWSKTTLIKDEENPYVQELTMIGLFEATGAWGKVETTTATTTTQRNLDDIAMRRAQLGARMKAFYRTEVTGIVEMAGNSRMNGIQTLKARTEISENTGVTIGKFRPLSTQENGTPDGELLTNERSLMSNMIAPADSLGVMFDAKNKDWTYQLGWFSGDYSDMIPNVKDNGFINAGMAYETIGKTETGVPLRSRWYLNLLHNLDKDGSEVLPRHPHGSSAYYDDIVSTGFAIQQDRFGLQGDFTIARGDKNAWGFTLTPSYWIMPNTIQLVGRYHYADTDQINALSGGYGTSTDPFFSGNESVINGDEYHSFYFGANVHLYENRMILSNGIEYSIFKDELDSGDETKSLLWQSGARLSF